MNKTALSLAALVASAVQAHALEDVVDVDFLHGWRESDGHHYAGVTITLAEGWKTYWRAPQGAGIPPVFTVLEHSNLDTMQMEFPKPMMLEDFGEKVLGYKDQVTLPLIFKTHVEDAPTKIAAELRIGVCSDICIPVKYTVAVELPPTGQEGAQVIKAAMKTGPSKPEQHGISKVDCQLSPDGKTTTMSSVFSWPSAEMPMISVVEYPSDAVWVAPVKASVDGSTMTLTTELKNYGSSNFIERDKIKLSVLTDNHIFEFNGCSSS